MTIYGAGANVTIIKGNTGWTDRILQLHSGKTATITGVTITGGNLDTGGGVRNSAGNLTISYSTISGNAAPTATGGGIYSDGPITLTHVSVLSNTAGTFAGGIRLAGGAAVFTNTTFSGNSAKENAGGVYIAAGSLTMDNVTITNNTADSDGVSPSGDGGGIRATGATVTIKNTVIAGNVDNTSTQRPDCYGTLTSSGYNHIGNMTGCTMTPTSGDNTSGVSAQLAALANNGGTTLTHLPQSSSPVIDLGNGCITADQRGYARNGTCDKGAAEFGGIAPVSILTKTYYFVGSQLVAIREITTTGLAGTLYYLHQDHLGSTSLTTSITGSLVSRQLFYAYGEVRWSTGTMPTTIGYTGQRRDSGLGSLMFYNARYYSPLLSRFISADTIVPGAGNLQAFNRYMYVLGNPLRYTDPSGFFSEDEIMDYFGVKTWNDVLDIFRYGALQNRWAWLELMRISNYGDIIEVAGYTYRFANEPKNGLMLQSYTHCPSSPCWGTQSSVRSDDGLNYWLEDVARSGPMYTLKRRDSDGSLETVWQSAANKKHNGIRGIDWIGLGLDLTGIGLDLASVGLLGKAEDLVTTARRGGRLLDLYGVGNDWADLGVNLATGKIDLTQIASSQEGQAFGIAILDLASPVPFIMDGASILHNISQFEYGP